MGEMIAIGIMVALIILASSVHKYVDRRYKNSIPTDAEERILTRLDELDRRISDIQDVMITLDDKIGRKEQG